MCTSSGGDQKFLYHQFIGSPSQLWWKWRVTVLTIMTDLTGFTHSLAPWWWSFSSRLQSVRCVMIVKHSSLCFIYQVDKWERTLSLILEVTEMILTVQRQWMYLEVCYLQWTVLSVNVLSSFFLMLRKWQLTSLASSPRPPIPYFSSSHCLISVTGAWNGGSWLGCGNLPAMWAIFYLGAGWPQWKPLGIPGTHLPLKRGSWLSNLFRLVNILYHWWFVATLLHSRLPKLKTVLVKATFYIHQQPFLPPKSIYIIVLFTCVT